MHPAALRNFSDNIAALPHNFRQRTLRVLDMGGQDVNGTVHSALALRVAALQLDVLDIEDGKGVTIVGDARRVDWWDERPYDLVISTEMLEHLEGWQGAVAVVHKVLQPGGWFVGTCASYGRLPHGATGAPHPAPGEWYQNIAASTFIGILSHRNFDEIHVGYQQLADTPTTNDLHWRARKAAG